MRRYNPPTIAGEKGNEMLFRHLPDRSVAVLLRIDTCGLLR